MRERIRRVAWLLGVVWFLSWFELYLEIYRHQHATLASIASPISGGLAPGLAGHAGGWLRTVLVCSAFAPPVFVLLRLWLRADRARDRALAVPRPSGSFPIGVALTLFGLILGVTGTLNQLIRRPPVVLDLTLRTGNLGFVIVGGALALSGIWLRRAQRRRHPAGVLFTRR